MLTSIRSLVAATLLGSVALAASPALADDGETAPPAEFTVSGNVALVSDYRFRGISFTAGDPAIQGSINVNHSSGLYVGTWSSSIEDSAVYGSQEVDLYAGWTGSVASGVTLDAGLLYYVYPNGKVGKANYFEPYASVSTTLGPVTAKLGAAYAWKQSALGNQDNLYVYTDLSAGIPNTPVSLSAHVGLADGVQSPNLLTLKSTKAGFDYSVGASYNITDKLSLGVSYTGVDGNSAKGFSDDAVVGTLKLTF